MKYLYRGCVALSEGWKPAVEKCTYLSTAESTVSTLKLLMPSIMLSIVCRLLASRGETTVAGLSAASLPIGVWSLGWHVNSVGVVVCAGYTLHSRWSRR